jgi:phosphate transport system substrate-binding protein
MVKMRDSSVVSLVLLTAIVVGTGNSSPATAYPAFPQADAAAKGATVKIQGSSNITPLNQSLKQGFEKQYAGAKVNIANSSTKVALESVVTGKADMAAIGRPLTEAEKAQGLFAVPVGRDKIAIVVGKNNPYKKDLTITQFAKLFRGEAKNWSELGGAKAPIQLVDRTETDTRRSFPNYPAFQNKAFDSGSTAVKLADENPAAMSAKLGTSGVSFLPASLVASQSDIRVLSMHKVLPTDARYPFSQPLYYVYKGGAAGAPNDAVKAFLGYAGTKAGQAAVSSAGIAQAINFNNAAEKVAVAQAEKAAAIAAEGIKAATIAAGAGVKAGGADVKTTALNAEGAKPAVDPAKTGETKVEAAKPDGAVANNQIAVGDEVGRGIPPWLWWLLLPLGLLGLLLWLLPKDDDDEPPLRPAARTDNAVGPAGSSKVTTAVGKTGRNALQGVGDAAGRATGAVGDAAGRTAGAVSDVAGKATGTVTDAAKSGGAAAVGIGAAIAGAGAAAIGRFKGQGSSTASSNPTPTGSAESEWEPGANDEFKIDTPDWNINPAESGEVVVEESGSWLQGVRDKASDGLDNVKGRAGNVLNRTGDALGDAKNAGGSTGSTIAGVGAAAAGTGAAAWSVLTGRGESDVQSGATTAGGTPESNWEFEGGDLPSANLDLNLPDVNLDGSPRIVDYAGERTGNVLDRASGAASGAFNRAKSGVGDLAGSATDAAGNVAGQVKSTTANLTGNAANAADGSANWLNKWLGKAKDATEDAASGVSSSATGAADRLKDSIANTGAAAMAAGGAAAAGTGAAIGGVFNNGKSRVVMVPYNSREALVRWELDKTSEDQVRNQGGNQLVLRLYDVTNVDVNSQDLPTFEQFDVDELKKEQRILIPQRDRTYMTVLGYLTRSGGFLELSRSAVVQIPTA